MRTSRRPTPVGPTDDPSDMSYPRDDVAPDGSLWIADAGFGRILQIGYEGTGTVTSGELTPDVVKAFTYIHLEAPAQAAKTGFVILYSLDGIAFEKRRLERRPQHQLPGRHLGDSLPLSDCPPSTDRWATPLLKGLTIHLVKAKRRRRRRWGRGRAGRERHSGGSAGTPFDVRRRLGGRERHGHVGSGMGSGSSGYGSGQGAPVRHPELELRRWLELHGERARRARPIDRQRLGAVGTGLPGGG